MLCEGSFGFFLVRNADDDQDEMRVVRFLTQPDDAHPAVVAVVNEMQTHETAIEVDTALDVARARRHMGQMGSVAHRDHRVAMAATARTSMASTVEFNIAEN